ncbi:TniQ family protein [Mesorhizobium sp. B2-4-3]|uniref:TniQ family protein n=1 Tax=Mesorhizobium sp. B2-4-3 TaxID=2589946 RepID=UPI00112D7A42|nr:TniQ family protein [Mesorhizobium sp. B2-4-3]TPL73238.1 hypothetical protein FJ956_10395 [Mesorhizobium sp. B2-4-3]
MSVSTRNRKVTDEEMAAVPAFPLWVPHHPEEPSYSLLSRTVERNVPGDFPRVASSLGAYGGHAVTAVSVSHAARISAADLAAVAHATPSERTQKKVRVLGHVLRSDDFSVGRRKWCPACLSDHGAHLAWWDIRFVATCPRHRLFLIDQCVCGQKVGWKSRTGFSFCRCRRSLADQVAAPASDQECAADAYVIGRLTGVEPISVPLLDCLPLIEVIDTIRRVGHFALDPHLLVRAIEKKHGLGRIMSEGFAALADFPRSFQALLDRTVEAAEVPQGKFGSRRVYGDEFMTWLVQEEPQKLNGALSREVRDHANRHLTLCRNRPLLNEIVSQDFMTITEAAAACGFTSSRMKNILKQHGLVPHETSLGLPTKLDAQAVLELIEKLRNAVDVEAVEAELGIAPRVLHEIIAEGHLTLLVAGKGVKPLMEREAAGSLLGRLRGKLRHGGVPEGSMGIPLAAKSLCMPVAKVITEVLDDRLTVVKIGDSHGLASIILDVNGRRSDYRRSRTPTMTARDVATTFGVKEDVSIALLKAGAIVSEREGHHWLADRDSAERFFRENARMVEYAGKLGTSANYLNAFLDTHGIQATFGPPVVDRKFFPRADAEALFARTQLPERKSNKQRFLEPA